MSGRPILVVRSQSTLTSKRQEAIRRLSLERHISLTYQRTSLQARYSTGDAVTSVLDAPGLVRPGASR